MDKELKILLHRKLDKPRPRPLMYVGRQNGKRCYVRKHSLSYFQLLKKYPPPFQRFGPPLKQYHILRRHHHFSKSLLERLWLWLKALVW